MTCRDGGMTDKREDTRYRHRSGSGSNEPKHREKRESAPDWTSRQSAGQTQSEQTRSRPEDLNPRGAATEAAQGKATRGDDEVATRRHLEGSEQGPPDPWRTPLADDPSERARCSPWDNKPTRTPCSTATVREPSAPWPLDGHLAAAGDAPSPTRWRHQCTQLLPMCPPTASTRSPGCRRAVDRWVCSPGENALAADRR